MISVKIGPMRSTRPPRAAVAAAAIILTILLPPSGHAGETEAPPSLPDLVLPKAKRPDAPQPADFEDPAAAWEPRPFAYRRIYPLNLAGDTAFLQAPGRPAVHPDPLKGAASGIGDAEHPASAEESKPGRGGAS